LRNKFNHGVAPLTPEAQAIPKKESKKEETSLTRKKSSSKIPSAESKPVATTTAVDSDDVGQLKARIKELEELVSKKDAEIASLKVWK
jgi:hypothetical protein